MSLDLKSVIDFLDDGRKANYSNMASLSLVIFDYILTLRQEIELIWMTEERWSAGSIIFIAFRYYGLLAQIFYSYIWVNTISEADAIKFQVAANTSILGLSEAILTWRVWVMYDRSIYLGFFIAFILLANYATITGFSVKAFTGPIIRFALPPALAVGCDTVVIPFPRFLFLSFIPHAVTGLVLFILTAAKTFRTVRSENTPTVALVLRDGILYFAVTVLIELVNGMFLKYARSSMKGAVAGFQIAIPYAMTCRLILNIQGLLRPPGPKSRSSGYGDSHSRTTSLQFAPQRQRAETGVTATLELNLMTQSSAGDFRETIDDDPVLLITAPPIPNTNSKANTLHP